MRFTVSGIPKHYNDPELEELFAPFGRVNFVKVYFDSLTLKSRGKGIVEMPFSNEAEAAMKELHGKPIGVNTLKIKIEPDNNAHEQRGGGRDNFQGGRDNFQRDSYRPKREEESFRPRRSRIPFNQQGGGRS